MQLLYPMSRATRLASLAILVLGVGFVGARVDGETISTTVTTVGSNLYQYSYTMTGFNLLANQELDIQFDPTVFQSLSGGVAGSGYTLAVLQPNVPPSSTGDYTIVSDGSNPTLIGTFSVDASLMSGIASPPSEQPFLVYQLSNGKIVSTIATGDVNGPEPDSGLLVAAGVVMVGILSMVRGRFRLRRQAAKVS